jgi:dTDP-4-dehydrorhamnose reductase
MIKMYKPWAIINCAGYVNVDLAESNIKDCLEINTRGVINLAQVCKDNHVKLLTFSSDLVFNGYKLGEYTEHDKPDPQNIYGLSKYLAEHFVLLNYPETLMVRTSSFFSPCDEFNFLSIVFNEISEGRKFIAANDVIISPTYLPHLVNKCLDLMIDDEKGIFHLTNKGAMTWAQFASVAAEHAGFKSEFIIEANINQMNLKARRPSNSALISVKGEFLPAVSKGINEFVKEYHINKFKSRKHNLIQ